MSSGYVIGSACTTSSDGYMVWEDYNGLQYWFLDSGAKGNWLSEDAEDIDDRAQANFAVYAENNGGYCFNSDNFATC